MNTSLILIIGASIIALYSVIVHLYAKKESNSNIWSWYHRLVSTIASVTLGVYIAMTTFLLQQNTIKESRHEALKEMVKQELLKNKEVLESDERGYSITHNEGSSKITNTKLTSLALETAIQSGVFDSDLSLHMLTMIRDIIEHNNSVTQFLSLVDPNHINVSYPHKVNSAANMTHNYKAKIIQHTSVMLERLNQN